MPRTGPAVIIRSQAPRGSGQRFFSQAAETARHKKSGGFSVYRAVSGFFLPLRLLSLVCGCFIYVFQDLIDRVAVIIDLEPVHFIPIQLEAVSHIPVKTYLLQRAGLMVQALIA